MRTTQYVQQEKAIASADSGSIRERCLWALRVLDDPEAIAPGGGLRHGAAARLIEAAERAGRKLSEREIQRRLQCARAYPKESQIRHAVSDFGAWRELVAAGFPPYDAPEDEPPADYRTKAERRRDANRAQAADAETGGQLGLFPLDQFEPAESTVKELGEYAREQLEMTERFLARDRARLAYVEQLEQAADGDLSMSWADAHARIPGAEPIGSVAS